MTQAERQPRKLGLKTGLGIGAATILAGTLGFNALTGGYKGPEQTSAGSYPSQGPTSTELATQRPSEGGASPSPEIGVSYSPEGHYGKASFATVKAGDIVVGDVKAANFGTPHTPEGLSQFARMYDIDTDKEEGVTNNANTGSFTVFEVDGEVFFPYEGDIVRDIENRDLWIANQKMDMENGGCDDGCSEGVKDVHFTGIESTVTQSGTLAKDVLVKDNATEVPLSEVEDVTGLDFEGMPSDEVADIVLKILNSDILTPDQESALLKFYVACICKEQACIKPEASPSPMPSKQPEACPKPDDKVLNFEKKTFNDIFGFMALGDDRIRWDKDGDGDLSDEKWVKYHDDDGATAAVSRKWFGTPTDVQFDSHVGGTDVIFFKCPDKTVYEGKLDEVIQATLDSGRTIDPESLK